ncbi:MAG: YifB family Mg chelatase-like AAA ATPase [Candidatus Contendobacter sp.]|nr:YifB family Mg chelatase-like AAA ATPase [Candidatus Contendobacter sp.]
MSLAIVYTRAQVGIDAPLVSVEVHLSGGLPGLFIVGLPEAAVKESKDRVRGAILNSQFEFPSRRITINLAPADLPKEGGRFDLPIALGILAASGQINRERLGQYEFLGELALGGEVRGVRGVLPAALACHAAKRTLLVPGDNVAEAQLVGGVKVLGAVHLLEVCRQLATGAALQPPASQPRAPLGSLLERDLSDVRGQHHAKRALEIAAAGGHNLLLIGPPGTGKTMLASRLPGIMPPLTEAEALETAAIASISAQGLDLKQWGVRPFRAPHHTASGVALVGGGGQPRPGEISLAHHGVLFLDELPEYDRRVLEVLREPLESGRITISRAARQADFPARFQLVAAMNPCPCGYLGDAERRCACGQEQVRRYRARVSGPLIDRIDLHIEVPRLAHRVLRGDVAEESSATVRARVCAARDRQLQRAGKANSALGTREIERYCALSESDHRLLEQALERLGLSPRAYHRILKVARTIADLAGGDGIKTPHLTEAISYRALDRSRMH